MSWGKINAGELKTGKHNRSSDYPRRRERERAKEEYEKSTEHMV